jgi:hypothetical protein
MRTTKQSSLQARLENLLDRLAPTYPEEHAELLRERGASTLNLVAHGEYGIGAEILAENLHEFDVVMSAECLDELLDIANESGANPDILKLIEQLRSSSKGSKEQ